MTLAIAAPHIARPRWVTVWEAQPDPIEEVRARVHRWLKHQSLGLMPLLGPRRSGSWGNATTAALTADFGGWAGETCRVVIASAQLSRTGLQKIRMTFEAQSAGTLVVSSSYIGIAGGATAYAFGGAPTQITSLGSGSFTVPSGGTLVSDELNFSLNAGADLVVSLQSASTSSFRINNASTGYSFYFKGGASDTATQAATGYSGPYGSIKACFFNRIEAFG